MNTIHKYCVRIALLVICIFCTVSPVDAQNINRPNISCPGNVEVNSYTGNMFMSRNDLFIRSRKLSIDLTFYYNSSMYAVNQGYGKGWSHHYLMRIKTDSAGVTVTHGDGRTERFEGDTSQAGPFLPPKGTFDSLAQYQPGKYVLITPSQLRYFFDDPTHRRLTRMEERNGNYLNFQYTDSLLSAITDPYGRTVQLVYTNGKLTSALDNNGSSRTIVYQYDQYSNLIRVTDPLGYSIRYEYLINGPMSEVTDKNGNGVNIIYQPNFAVKEVISCNTQHVFSYNTTALSTTVVETVESGNQISVYTFDASGYLKKKSGNCCGYNVTMTYDNNGNMVSYTNANGQKNQYTYDAKGRMLSAIDPMGKTSFYTYEPQYGKLTSYRNRNGAVIQYSYDNKGNLIQVAYPLNIINTYTYNALGDLLTITDGKGNTTTLTYDTYGNLTGAQRPLGYNVTLGYDLKSRLISYTDPNNNSTEITYDPLDRVLSVEDATNNSFVFTYDANGNILTLRDRKLQTVSYAYDALDRPVSMTNPLIQTTLFQYDARSNILSITRPDNAKYRFGYDHLNRLISATNPENEITQYAYDNRGNITSLSLPNGNSISYSYDALNRLTEISDAIGTVSAYNYDAIGNVVSSTDANGNGLSYTYDALSRRTGITDAMGKTAVFSYDPNSNITALTDRKGKTQTFTYDALDRMVSVMSALNHTTSFGYDPSGNLTAVTDAKGNTTTYTYDVLNRNTMATYANGSTNILAYDPNGNVTSYTDGNGVNRTLVYDALNRLVNIDFPGNNDDTYAYDAAGRLISAINPDATVNFTYDDVGRITTESMNGKTTNYTYDVPGNMVTIQYPGGRTIQKKTDARGRLIQVVDGTSVLVEFLYDPADRLISKVFPANNTQTNYTYDAMNRMTAMSAGPGNMISTVFTYDANGNKLSDIKSHRPDMSEVYTYDDDSRLTGFKRGTPAGNVIPSPVLDVQYTYDALGNRVNTDENGIVTAYTSNNMNAYTAINGAINSTPLYDGNGNLINDGSYTYSYNHKNQMTAVNNGAVAEYKYDALGRRIRKETGGAVVEYAYSGVQEIENYNGAGQLTGSYVFGYGVDKILSADLNNSRYFYYSNPLGSVQALAGANGAITERYEYEPFGTEQIYDDQYNFTGTSSAGNNILFTGRTLNTETGNYYFRARTYNDNTGRFEQRDPLSYNAGDMNLYGYVFNAPTAFTDLMGLKIDCGAPKEKSANEKAIEFADNARGAADFVADIGGTSKQLQEDLNSKSRKMLSELRSQMNEYKSGAIQETIDKLDYDYAQKSSKLDKVGKVADKIGKVTGPLGTAKGLYDFYNDPSLGKGVDVISDALGYSPFAAPVATAFDIGFGIGSLFSTGELKSLGDMLDEVDWDYAFGNEYPCDN